VYFIPASEFTYVIWKTKKYFLCPACLSIYPFSRFFIFFQKHTRMLPDDTFVCVWVQSMLKHVCVDFFVPRTAGVDRFFPFRLLFSNTKKRKKVSRVWPECVRRESQKKRKKGCIFNTWVTWKHTAGYLLKSREKKINVFSPHIRKSTIKEKKRQKAKGVCAQSFYLHKLALIVICKTYILLYFATQTLTHTPSTRAWSMMVCLFVCVCVCLCNAYFI